jgi:nitronate monooxygenase
MGVTTRFTELVGCTVPIQLAGMHTNSDALVVAVADAGGLAMVSEPLMPADYLARRLDALRARTDGTLGVNFLMPFLDRGCVEAAATRVRVVEFFYAAPDAELVAFARQSGALVSWQVGSEDEARAAEQAGCDFVIAQGVEAGGHLRGTLGLLPLLSRVLDVVRCPVLAAGGIATPRDVAAVLAAGADGVRVGTRFVASAESDAHPRYQELLVAAAGEDTVYTEAFSVMWPDAPHRVLRSAVDAAERADEVVGEMEIAGTREPVPRFAVPAPTRDTTGTIDAMALYAGQSVGSVRAVEPAAAIVRDLAEGAERLLAREHPNAALVRRLFDAFARRDLATILAVVPDDVVWHFPGRRGGLAGSHRGRDAVLGFLAAVEELTGGTFHLDVLDVTASERHAVALFRGHAQRDGKRLDNPTSLVVRFDAGRIVEVHEFVWDLHHVEDFWS